MTNKKTTAKTAAKPSADKPETAADLLKDEIPPVDKDAEADAKAKAEAEERKQAEADAKQAKAEKAAAENDKGGSISGPGIIKSSHDCSLTLHTGVVVPAGRSVKVPDLGVYNGHRVFDAWCVSGVLSFSEEGE